MPHQFYKIEGRAVGRYDYEVLVLAQALHCSVTGASERLPANEAVFVALFLRERLNDWSESSKFWKDYDEAVRSVLKASLVEYEHRDQKTDEAAIREHGLKVVPLRD